LFVSILPFPLVNLNWGPDQEFQGIFIAPEAFDVMKKSFARLISQWQALAGFNFKQVRSTHSSPTASLNARRSIPAPE
jgi:hypothetical protein